MPITVKTCATVGEAASALAASRGARFLAGGTLVMRDVNEGDLSLETIVRVSDGNLAEIRASGARITIGAGVTMAQIIANRDLAFLHPVARVIGGPAVRTMATVGGNLFAGSPYGDFTAALLALEATVSVQGSFGAREQPMEEFLSGRDRNTGVVASVTLTRPNGDAFRFRKFSRVRPKGVSVLSIAAHLPLSGGRVSNARVAYGAMAPTPIRAKAVERALEGRSLDEAGIAAAIAAAAEGTNPATDAIASAWYRREMVAVNLRRLLLAAPA